jgi:hypothetical protein
MDVMNRGNWALLLVFAVLIGAAIVLFARPSRYGALSAALCFGAGLLNAVPVFALLSYNVAGSDGPLGPRVIGVAFAAALALLPVGSFVEGIGFARGEPRAVAALPQQPV